MTMLSITRTDMFGAAISHAGISSISSYWGEGNWGFASSAAATTKSDPWNRPAALRVPGKEVEYIVAWFDKHLKDDAAWWRHLRPEDE